LASIAGSNNAMEFHSGLASTVDSNHAMDSIMVWHPLQVVIGGTLSIQYCACMKINMFLMTMDDENKAKDHYLIIHKEDFEYNFHA
jgi:hypothetical protein